MELVLPSVEYKESFIAALKEFAADKDVTDRSEAYRKISVSELENDFSSFVERQKSHARGENLPEGYVPDSEFWLVDGAEYIGRLDVRHRLTPHLETHGGHIGYDIRPSARGKGYGSLILKLGLEKARELGIMRILVLCNANNTASRKVIEKNGGVYQDAVPNAETGIDKLRFWIENR
jgi:predicted acetyltransferase